MGAKRIRDAGNGIDAPSGRVLMFESIHCVTERWGRRNRPRALLAGEVLRECDSVTRGEDVLQSKECGGGGRRSVFDVLILE